MLDQNTDRMWYVIGAIVIGAAIIAMGLNIFDSSFDSVGVNFSQLTDNAEIALEFGFESNSPNLYTGPSEFKYEGYATGYGTTMGDRAESVFQRDIKVKPNTTYRINYRRGDKTDGLIVLTHTGVFQTNIKSHNGLYSSSRRLRQLKSDVDGAASGDKVSMTFTTSDVEEFVTITSGNRAIVDEPFGWFSNYYNGIHLYEVID